MDGFCEEETERRDGNDHARHPTSSFGNLFTQALFTETLFTETLFTKTLFTQTFHKNPIKCCVSKINQIYPVMNQCSHAATEHVAVTM